MTTIKKITIEHIQEFIKRKGFYWDGRIRDLYRIITRKATIEDFQGKRMVRLIVTHKNHKEEFIQRIIVSPEVFRIEKPSLRKMDNFVSFNEEWIEYLNSKVQEEQTITEIINSEKTKFVL